MTLFLEVHGLRELQRDLKRMGGELPVWLKARLRDIAEPIAEGAERRSVAVDEPRVGRGWEKARVGVTMREVYVVPEKRGVKSKTDLAGRRRPKFGVLLMREAYEPALDAEKGQIVPKLDLALRAITEKV